MSEPLISATSKLGAAAIGENGSVHPTAAGLLMFGDESDIVREYPRYFLDYREEYDDVHRWTDRVISSSGDWSGNVFDFYFRVYNKLQLDLKVPFEMDGIYRVDDTPVHRALREALADGTVDCIATDHAPHHVDDKNVEFLIAASGISGWSFGSSGGSSRAP